MAVSVSRVTDERTLPGSIEHSLSPAEWTPLDGTSTGCFALMVGSSKSGEAFQDNIVVIVNRFVFDHGVQPVDLLDHAFADGRALHGWREESARRWPPQNRHSGWSLQTGRYVAGHQSLFVASTYAVHERGNVGYLVQTTATVRDDGAESSDHARLVSSIQTVNFVD